MDEYQNSRQRRNTTYLGFGVLGASLALALFGLVQLGADRGGPLETPIAVSPSASPSAPAPVVRSDTVLRLQISGLPIFTDGLATPPIVEVSPNEIVYLDLTADRDPSQIAELTRVGINPTLFAQIVEEAKTAGLEGNRFLLDEDDLVGVTHTLTLIEDDVAVASLILNGIVNEGEGGAEAAVRASIWAFIQRLLDPLDSYALSGATPYLPERFSVYADALDPAMIGDMNVEPQTWTIGNPTSWTNGCQVFTGAEASAVAAALAPLPIGRYWLDAGGAPWSMYGRPLTPSEPSPCG